MAKLPNAPTHHPLKLTSLVSDPPYENQYYRRFFHVTEMEEKRESRRGVRETVFIKKGV
jgi:hypothetical protein